MNWSCRLWNCSCEQLAAAFTASSFLSSRCSISLISSACSVPISRSYAAIWRKNQTLLQSLHYRCSLCWSNMNKAQVISKDFFPQVQMDVVMMSEVLKWPYAEDCSWLHQSVLFSPPAACIALSGWTTSALVFRFSVSPQRAASPLKATPLPPSEWHTEKEKKKRDYNSHLGLHSTP